MSDSEQKVLKIEYDFRKETTSVEFRKNNQICVSAVLPDQNAELIQQVLKDFIPSVSGACF